MFEQANPEHLEVTDAGGHMRYRGRHRGFIRLPQPVVVERTLTLSRMDGSLAITDVLEGQGEHRLGWHFHFAPGVQVTIAADDLIEIRTAGVALGMRIPPALRPTLAAAWYSPLYGVRQPCVSLDLVCDQALDGRHDLRLPDRGVDPVSWSKRTAIAVATVAIVVQWANSRASILHVNQDPARPMILDTYGYYHVMAMGLREGRIGQVDLAAVRRYQSLKDPSAPYERLPPGAAARVGELLHARHRVFVHRRSRAARVSGSARQPPSRPRAAAGG